MITRDRSRWNQAESCGKHRTGDRRRAMRDNRLNLSPRGPAEFTSRSSPTIRKQSLETIKYQDPNEPMPFPQETPHAHAALAFCFRLRLRIAYGYELPLRAHTRRLHNAANIFSAEQPTKSPSRQPRTQPPTRALDEPLPLTRYQQSEQLRRRRRDAT
jgi:hypothetical protein